MADDRIKEIRNSPQIILEAQYGYNWDSRIKIDKEDEVIIGFHGENHRITWEEAESLSNLLPEMMLAFKDKLSAWHQDYA